ncbi:hypothetical protein FK220_017115 [Flavobacteriaceae bacterium TP-CH-4]|uniref:Uncharacterized protein n=1 Tax=Pelagihabitans pacificus TaxID=2696054 RepID=A0A967AXT3_9FLAO|nr:hypothetical protein [Pelagihabitans pacificus]NHF61075.1 hypothetical protein [Pelagihabitans pacificus]
MGKSRFSPNRIAKILRSSNRVPSLPKYAAGTAWPGPFLELKGKILKEVTRKGKLLLDVSLTRKLVERAISISNKKVIVHDILK